MILILKIKTANDEMLPSYSMAEIGIAAVIKRPRIKLKMEEAAPADLGNKAMDSLVMAANTQPMPAEYNAIDAVIRIEEYGCNKETVRNAQPPRTNICIPMVLVVARP